MSDNDNEFRNLQHFINSIYYFFNEFMLQPHVEQTSYPDDKIRPSQNAVRGAMSLRYMRNWSLILTHS